MKVLVIGARGFIGKGVSQALSKEHEVIPADRNVQDGLGVNIDLRDPKSIVVALDRVRPDAIVDCAGVVENNEKAQANPLFTKNLLEQVVASGLPIQRVVVMGSAGEYGVVNPDELPVKEDAPRRATSPYGVSKIEESDVALDFRNKHHLPVIVARLFNPIGAGMDERMIIPRVQSQIAAVRAGTADRIEINRLDARRDYVDVRDIGTAVGALLGSKEPQSGVYNIGSGVSTSNQDLITLMVAESGLPNAPKLVETSGVPEPLFAAQADISRIHEEFGWTPSRTVNDTVRSLMHDQK